jgi:hypothetical protein
MGLCLKVAKPEEPPAVGWHLRGSKGQLGAGSSSERQKNSSVRIKTVNRFSKEKMHEALSSGTLL